MPDVRIQRLSTNSGDHKTEGKTACKWRSTEVQNPRFKEGRVNVEDKCSTSEHQDRLEKNDQDKCSWLTRLIRQPGERGFLLCFGFYKHYLSLSAHIQVGSQSSRISLSILWVRKLRQQETKFLVHGYNAVKQGLLRPLIHGLWVRIKVCSSLRQTVFGQEGR